MRLSDCTERQQGHHRPFPGMPVLNPREFEKMGASPFEAISLRQLAGSIPGRLLGIGLLVVLSGNSPRVQAHSLQTGLPKEYRSHAKENLLGDMGGFREWLYRYGVNLNIQSDDELWVNAQGGTRQHEAYEGIGTIQIGIDPEKLTGIKGGWFNVSWLNIRGRSITQDRLADYNPISGYEAYRSNRLLELWYQQGFWNDRLNVKVGQQALDNEFLLSDYANLFLNSNFGWPMAPSINLYAGGPSWPLASLGARVSYQPTDQLSWLFAVADDNPPGHSFYNANDPTNQSVHPHGDNFNLGGGALFINEFQYSINPQPDNLSDDSPDPGLPGTYKIGGIYDTGQFADQRYDKDGKPLASPDSTGTPKEHRGNWILYAVMDQMVWRPSLSSPTSVGVFARITDNRSDRNVVDFAADAGFNLNAPFESRTYDAFGIGWGMGHTGKQAREADRDARSYSNDYYPIRQNEHHIEVTYKAQVTPWFFVQPDFQYIYHPGGGGLNEKNDHRAHNEMLFGVHTRVVL